MSPVTEKDKARENIHKLLIKAGWRVFDADMANIMLGKYATHEDILYELLLKEVSMLTDNIETRDLVGNQVFSFLKTA